MKIQFASDLHLEMAANAASVKSITVDGALVSEGTNVLPKDKIGSVIEIELD